MNMTANIRCGKTKLTMRIHEKTGRRGENVKIVGIVQSAEDAKFIIDTGN